MNLSDKAKAIIGSVAPLIGTAIGGPFGALAGTLVHAALGTGGDDKALEAAVTSGNPDALLKLKQADLDFKTKTQELGIQEEQLQLQDVANARSREIAVRDNTPRNLAYGLVGGTLALIACTMMGWTKADSVIAGTMIGYLISECKAALQYYFGTSRSSLSKDETIADIAKSP